MTIKGLYIVEGYPYPDFDELENRGLTHIFYVDNFLLNNYTTCNHNINRLINAMGGTNLSLHIAENAFLASDQASLVDPSNNAHRKKLQDAIIQLLTDIPDIDGISLYDFEWQQWSGYDGVQQSTILADFAKQIASAVHDYDPSKKLSASLNWTSPTLPLTSAELDFVMPKIFSTNTTGTSISNAIKKVLKLIDDTDMVVDLLTYDSAVKLTPRKISEIYNEISTVINIIGVNYSLYASPWIPFGLGFPSEDYSFTQINLELNLVSKHEVIPEKSSRVIAVNFIDQNNNPISDDLLTTVVGEYKITDQSTGRIIKPFTRFIPDKSIYKLDISGEDNRIMKSNVSQENHIVTVSVVYGNGKNENEELLITVQNLLGI